MSKDKSLTLGTARISNFGKITRILKMMSSPCRRTLISSISRDADLHLPSLCSVGACSSPHLPRSSCAACCFPYFKDTLPNISVAFTFSDSLHFVNKNGLYLWHGTPDKLTLHVLLYYTYVCAVQRPWNTGSIYFCSLNRPSSSLSYCMVWIFFRELRARQEPLTSSEGS